MAFWTVKPAERIKDLMQNYYKRLHAITDSKDIYIDIIKMPYRWAKSSATKQLWTNLQTVKVLL